tara:strand:+ start:486 stop:797 length:312 start_codon:yes stop_codon:yes gene_type:complete
MSEINYPAMKPLNQLLPLDALFLYCASNIGEFTIDKSAKTISFNQTYTFDSNMLTEWETFLNNAKTEYKNELAPGQEMNPNDHQLFTDVENWIQIAKQLFEIT